MKIREKRVFQSEMIIRVQRLEHACVFKEYQGDPYGWASLSKGGSGDIEKEMKGTRIEACRLAIRVELFPPKIRLLKFSPLVPRNADLFGNRVLEVLIKMKLSGSGP